MSAIEFTPEQLVYQDPARSVVGQKDQTLFLHLAREVAAAHGLDVAAMLGRGRQHHLAVARADLYRALRARDWSYPRIGRAVGRDHSTVLAALQGPRASRRPSPTTVKFISVPKPPPVDLDAAIERARMAVPSTHEDATAPVPAPSDSGLRRSAAMPRELSVQEQQRIARETTADEPWLRRSVR